MNELLRKLSGEGASTSENVALIVLVVLFLALLLGLMAWRARVSPRRPMPELPEDASPRERLAAWWSTLD